MLITGYYTPSSRNTTYTSHVDNGLLYTFITQYMYVNSWSGKKDEKDQTRNPIVSLIHYFMVLLKKIIHDTRKLF